MYAAREYWTVQWVDCSAGDICDKEYSGECWMDEDVRPRAGGRVIVARMAGTGYVCSHAKWDVQLMTDERNML
jgi:hypothetical protein